MLAAIHFQFALFFSYSIASELWVHLLLLLYRLNLYYCVLSYISVCSCELTYTIRYQYWCLLISVTCLSWWDSCIVEGQAIYHSSIPTNCSFWVFWRLFPCFTMGPIVYTGAWFVYLHRAALSCNINDKRSLLCFFMVRISTWRSSEL